MKKIIVCLLLASASVNGDSIPLPVLSSTGSIANDSLYIINGTEAKHDNNRHMCSLQTLSETYWHHHCGASIISEEWVITAAHCLKINQNVSKIALKCDTMNITREGQWFPIAQAIAHQHFDFTVGHSVDYDIGLMRIEGKFNLDKKHLDRIALPNENDTVPVGAVVTVVGWGAMDKKVMPELLQTVDVLVLDINDCQKHYQKFFNITFHMFCAGLAQGGKDACLGDSGGPAVINGKLEGLVSGGNGCADKNYPGIYTSVGSLRSWVREHSGV